MIKLNLTYVSRTERISKNTQKPFTSVSIKAKEYGDKFLSGFGNKSNSTWAEGMEVEVAEVKEVVKDGKTYLNFEMPKFDIADLSKRVETLENAMTTIKLLLQKHENQLFPSKIPGTSVDYPAGDPPEPNFNIGDERSEPDDLDVLGFDDYPEAQR